MATKSITKNITIRNRSQCRDLLRALENASENRGKQVVYSRTVTNANQEQIQKMFGDRSCPQDTGRSN